MANVFDVPGVPSLPSYLPGALTLLSSDLSPASFVASAGQALLQWGIFRNGQPVIVPITGLTSGLQDFSIVNGIATNVIGNVLGLPTIFPVAASFVDVDYKQDWPISDYPIEQGGFQSYDKVRLPFSLRLRLAASGSQADLQAFLTVIQNMCEDGSLGNPSALTSAINAGLGALGINTAQVSSTLGAITGGGNLYDVVTPSRVYTNVSATHYDYRRTAVSGVSLLTVDVWFVEIQVTVSNTLNTTLFAQFAGALNIGNVSPQDGSGIAEEWN